MIGARQKEERVQKLNENTGEEKEEETEMVKETAANEAPELLRQIT